MKTQISLHVLRRLFVLAGLRSAVSILLTAALLAASGCSSGVSSSKLAVGPIAFTNVNGAAQSPLQVLSQGESTYLEVALTGDPEDLGANWSVYCGSALPPGTPLPPGQIEDESCGTFVPGHTTSGPIPSYATSAAGYVTLYTAPSAPPSQGVVTLYASSTTDPSRYVSATLTILGDSIGIHFAPAPPATLGVSASAQFTAVVVNDPTNAGVTWTAVCAQNSQTGCGSFNPVTTVSGISTLYTAPSSVPAGSGTVQITATSVADPTKSVSTTITIH